MKCNGKALNKMTMELSLSEEPVLSLCSFIHCNTSPCEQWQIKGKD